MRAPDVGAGVAETLLPGMLRAPWRCSLLGHGAPTLYMVAAHCGSMECVKGLLNHQVSKNVHPKSG